MKTIPTTSPAILNFFKIGSCTCVALLTATLILFAPQREACATVYVSNLDNQFSGGIGDIHGLFPGGIPYGNDIAHFKTGAGLYTLNFVTLEFYSGWQYINAQLVQNGIVLGQLGNPQVNPKQTQWPGRTTFINFYPNTTLQLNASTSYDVLLSNPVGSGGDAALLFSVSSAYSSPAGWSMTPTSSDNPFAVGQFLKLAIEATLVPEPTPTLLLGGSAVLAFLARRRCSRREILYPAKN
jgi:hypothetical protein